MATDDEKPKLQDLDDTIRDLIAWRQNSELSYKERLAVTDRLLKALQLKYKNSGDTRGANFKPKPVVK